MKASYYNMFFPFKDKYILFNTLRGSIFVVDTEIKNLIEKNDVSSLEENLKSMFEKGGALIDERLSEKDKMKLMYEKPKYDTSSASFHLITTYSCNLACVYCYEGKGELECKNMNKKTAKNAIKFIKELTSNNNSRSLGINLFGGEPLLNMPVNLFIAEKLWEWCNENNMHFSLNTVTNGTLLTSETVETLAVFKSTFGITLDGPKEIHNKRRMYKNGTGTFTDIIDGLSRIIDHNLNVMIRINVDETNRHHVVSLLSFLKENGLQKVIISIKPVFNTSPACLSYKYCIPDEAAFKVQNELSHIARTMNFIVDLPEKPRPQGACIAQKISYFTIDPYLRLFKCPILPPFKKNAVGIIAEDASPVFNWLNVDFLSRDPLSLNKCRDCKLIPICRGGCPAQIYDIKGTTHGNVCNASELYEIVKSDLINYAKRGTKK